jgi:glucosylceramidase
VCNVTYCDILKFELPVKVGEALIVSSSDKGLRFAKKLTKFRTEFSKHEDKIFFNFRSKIIVDRTKRYQKIVGFGNSMTGGVSYNLDILPQKLRHSIYNDYFNKSYGIAFNMLRMPIGGSDFDFEPWAYNETPVNDSLLSNFTKLDDRDVKKVAQIKELKLVAGANDLKMLGACWSPPRWMKSNNEWSGPSSLRREYYQTYALYHYKYLKFMQEAGLDYWLISLGNEAFNGYFDVVTFQTLGWNAIDQGRWLVENLGPLMRENFPDLKILAGDDQRVFFPWWFQVMFKAYPESKKYIYGFGVHWYFNSFIGPNKLEATYKKFPDKVILATEASHGAQPWLIQRPILGDWLRAEAYIIDIITDLNYYTSSWMEWCLALDQKGGPNYNIFGVDSSIIINETSE